MDSYAEGFLKAIEVVREYSLATENKEMIYQRTLGTTRLETLTESNKAVLNHLQKYYETEIEK